MNDRSIAGTTSPAPSSLAGAGKMGGAMLSGWLAQRARAGRVVRDRAAASAEISALAAKGIRLNPSARDIGAVDDAGGRGEAADRSAKPARAEIIRRTVHAGGLDHGGHHHRLDRSRSAAAAVVRAMPNTPAAIGRGITVAVAASNVSAAQRAVADALLRATGSVEWVDDESLMDAVTAVSGSGPAYVFLLAEELARAGVEAGLPAELATRLARETVAGSGELLHRSELASGDAAPERHLARRHHGRRARRADGRRTACSR